MDTKSSNTEKANNLLAKLEASIKTRSGLLQTGLVIHSVFILIGIAISFADWQVDYGSPFDTSKWRMLNPLDRAVIGVPLMFLLVAPISLPVLFIAGALIYCGFRRKELWFASLIGYLLFGVFWLFAVLIVCEMDRL